MFHDFVKPSLVSNTYICNLKKNDIDEPLQERNGDTDVGNGLTQWWRERVR